MRVCEKQEPWQMFILHPEVSGKEPTFFTEFLTNCGYKQTRYFTSTMQTSTDYGGNGSRKTQRGVIQIFHLLICKGARRGG